MKMIVFMYLIQILLIQFNIIKRRCNNNGSY
nr:MAG TPA: hypothetical protein [Caudoviricetes sp.]